MMTSIDYNQQSFHNKDNSLSYNRLSNGFKNFSNVTTTSLNSDSVSIDDTIASYHHTFCQFTGNYNGIWDVNRGLPDQSGSKARQKLKNLSKVHFSELSTDVFDELVRRVDPLPNETQFLAPRDNIHRKRNQARQKLAMLSPARFNDLATDILYEIERRYPNLRADPPEGENDEVEHDINKGSMVSNIDKSNSNGNSNSFTSPVPSSNSSPYLTSRPFSNGSQVSNATSRYTDDHLRDSIPRGSSLNNHKQSPTLASNNFTMGHNYNSSFVPPPQEEVSIPPSNRSAPLAQPIKSTTIIPKKSILVEEGDDEEEEEDDDDEVVNRDVENQLHSNGSIRSKRKSVALSDIEEEKRRNSTTSSFDVTAELKDKEEQIQMLVIEGSRMDEKINQLESQINELEITKGKLEEQIQSSEGIKNDLETQLHESETLKSTLFEENNRLHDMVGELENQRQAVVEEKSTIDKQLQDLKKELENSSAVIISHQTNITNLSEEKTKINDELTRTKALLDQLRNEHVDNSNLQSTFDDIKQENIKHVETIAGHEAKIDELQSQLMNSDEFHSMQILNLKQDHENKLNDLKSIHTNELETVQKELKSNHEKEVEELIASHQLKNDELTSTYSQQLEQLKSEKDSSINNQQSIDELKATHDKEIEDLINSHSIALQDIRSDHSSLQEAYNSLQQEYNNLKDNNNTLTKQISEPNQSSDYIALQNKLIEYESTINILKQQPQMDSDLLSKYEDLSKDHSKLQQELVEQHKITEQVRQEAKEFLIEMRALAESQRNFESAENLASQVQALKVEVQEWKSRYSRAKGQVRNLRNSTYSGGSVFQNSDISLSKENPYISNDGKVRDASVTRFQIAVDEFLTKSRLGTGDLLDNLHNVVIATRHITQDLNGPDDSPISEAMESELAQRATLVSKSANQLISTTRNHRISGGLAPISILDAVTSDLSFAVIELIKVAKIRPSSESSREVEINGNTASDVHPVVTPTEDLHLERLSKRYATTDDYAINFNIEDPDNTITELQGYLEEQTASAIDSIQSLLTGIKEGANLSVLRHNMLDIIKLVDITVIATSTSMKQTKNWLLKDKGSYILENLRDCSQRMAQLQEETKNINGQSTPDRQIKQRVAGIAFDMAKFTKELVKTVEEVSLTSEINHIDNQLR